jgi:hemerythrin superfamily protein
MEATNLLETDHRTVEDLFRRFESSGPSATVERRDLVDRMIEELSRHAAIEEQIFYPATRATVPEVTGDALESIEEHNLVKVLLAQLQGMDPEEERFAPKVHVLIELVREHVSEEEGTYFPIVRDALSDEALEDLGDAMASLRVKAPTRPHPELPDSPPANVLLAPAAAVVDRVADVLSGTAEGTFAGLDDLVARITDRGPRSPRPVGSSDRRRQSKRVRSGIDAGADAAERGVRSVANRAAEAVGGTADAVGRTAERAAKTAKRASRSTEKAASRASRSTKKAASRASGSTKKAAKRTTKATGKKASASRSSSTSTRATAKKAAGKRSAPKRTARKSTAKKATATKASTRKATAEKAGARKTTAKKARPR